MRVRRAVLPILGAAALLICAACKNSAPPSGSANQSASDQVGAEQKNAEQSLKRAADAQKKAGDEQKEATSAQEDVQDAQRKLTEAQQKETRQRAEAQQAQEHAQQEGTASQQQASQAQQRASQAQQTQEQQASAGSQAGTAQGEQTVAARVSQVNGNELVLDQGNPSRLKLNDSTQVTVDGQPASANQIHEGHQIRAAYRMDSGEATAIRVDATSK